MNRLFLGCALGLWLLLLIVHALGWRADVGFLSGTVPVTGESLAAGLVYVACWFGAVLVAPVLFLYALLDFAWLRLRRGPANEH